MSFFNKIEALNNQPTAQSVTTPLKRAFLNAKGEPYISQINVKACGEKIVGHNQILENIKQQNISGVNYMGAAGLLNLTYAAHLKAKRLILFDINPAQAVFWNEVSKNLARNPAPQGFKDDVPEMTANIYRNASSAKDYLGELSLLRGFDESAEEGFENGKNLSFEKWIQSCAFTDIELEWLRKPELYDHIHSVAKQDNICPLTIDVMDQEAWQQLAELFDEEECHADFAYMSNIIAFHGLNSGADFLGRSKDWEKDPSKIRENIGLCLTKGARIVAVEDLQTPYPYMACT